MSYRTKRRNKVGPQGGTINKNQKGSQKKAEGHVYGLYTFMHICVVWLFLLLHPVDNSPFCVAEYG